MSLLSTQFEILSLPFELTTNDKKFFKEFLELNTALTSPANGKSPWTQYSVIRNTKYFCIRENGKLRFRTTHRWPLYLFVMMRVRERLYLHLKDYLFLHSGAVVKDNKAILLVGASRSGKSTLTLSLLNYGYKYLTDEVVVISLSSLETIPFQRPIYVYRWIPPVSPETRKNFKFYRFKERYGRTIEPWQYVVPQRGAILPRQSSFDVAVIIFPRYNETQKSSYLRPMSKAEATFNLMQRGWNSPSFKDWGLKVCSELVKRAVCYQLEMGDLKEACELVEDLMGKVPIRMKQAKVLHNLWRRRLLM